MSASASSAGDDKGGASSSHELAPVQQCKGVNGLDKVVLREVRGCSAEVVYMFCLPFSLSLPRVPAARSRRGSRLPHMVLCVTEQSSFSLQSAPMY